MGAQSGAGSLDRGHGVDFHVSARNRPSDVTAGVLRPVRKVSRAPDNAAMQRLREPTWAATSGREATSGSGRDLAPGEVPGLRAIDGGAGGWSVEHKGPSGDGDGALQNNEMHFETPEAALAFLVKELIELLGPAADWNTPRRTAGSRATRWWLKGLAWTSPSGVGPLTLLPPA